jgi:cellulose synthase/poly-beta-1,6-N-acetylglucosamine synthase-like glycosyltransferase
VIASAILTCYLIPLFYYLFWITVASLFRKTVRLVGQSPPGERTRFLFVIPAHDEEAGIRSTVASCKSVSYDPDLFTVCVVADNCTDRTAAVARAAGAVVFERSAPLNRGKGAALTDFFDHARKSGAFDEYDAVVMVDADTIVDGAILSAFSAALAQGKDWLQCYNTVSNPEASRHTRLLTYAFSLYNGVWLAGQEALGLSVALRGNGMCFATRALARIPWEASGLAEDLEFTWVLRTRGERVHFVPGVSVRSEMLIQLGRAAADQRRRWEWGRTILRREFLAPLLTSRRLSLHRRLLYFVDLMFPPMITVLMFWFFAACNQLWPPLDPRMLALWRSLSVVHVFMALTLLLYAISPVFVMGLPTRFLLAVFDLPLFAAWKVVVSWGGKPAGWTRTLREGQRRRNAVRATPDRWAPWADWRIWQGRRFLPRRRALEERA